MHNMLYIWYRYARVAQRIGVVTFFHPLRLVAEGFSREYMSVDDIVLESLNREGLAQRFI